MIRQILHNKDRQLLRLKLVLESSFILEAQYLKQHTCTKNKSLEKKIMLDAWYLTIKLLSKSVYLKKFISCVSMEHGSLSIMSHKSAYYQFQKIELGKQKEFGALEIINTPAKRSKYLENIISLSMLRVKV